MELNNFKVSENDKVAFIFGNEVKGVSINAINSSDLIIKDSSIWKKKIYECFGMCWSNIMGYFSKTELK